MLRTATTAIPHQHQNVTPRSRNQPDRIARGRTAAKSAAISTSRKLRDTAVQGSGMILSESALSQQAAQETLPLRDAFAVLFFVSVGMKGPCFSLSFSISVSALGVARTLGGVIFTS